MHLKRILIAGESAIGDVLLTTPMVRTFKKAYPRAHLTYIIRAHVKDVLVNNPDIDELMPFDADILRRVTMQPAYDLAINFAGDRRTNQICLMSGAKYRGGSSEPQDMRIGRINLYNIFPGPYGARDVIDYFLSFARALGLEDATRETKLFFTPEEEDFADSFWKDCELTQATRVVGLHPGGQDPVRLWAVKDYARVADEFMADSGCRILVFQGPGEEETAKSVCQAMQHQALLVPLLEIRKYAALVKKCHLLISSDGGPIHIAAAVGVNMLGIYRKMNYRKGVSIDFWFPYRDRPGCLALLESLSGKITVQDVLTAARQLA